MLFIITVVLLVVFCIRLLYIVSSLRSLCGEIRANVLPFIACDIGTRDKIHAQLSAAHLGQPLPYNTILPFEGDKEIFDYMWSMGGYFSEKLDD